MGDERLNQGPGGLGLNPTHLRGEGRDGQRDLR